VVQPPPPAYWPPPRPLAWQTPGAIVAIVLAVGFGIFFLIFFVSGIGFGMVGFPFFIFAPFCAFFIVIIIVIALAASRGMTSSRIPPPPPIQQPMVPAGQVGPIALNCPNCGAPPQNVDRFGVATCTYCNTRFLVR
jgi:hypothetical protein